MSRFFRSLPLPDVKIDSLSLLFKQCVSIGVHSKDSRGILMIKFPKRRKVDPFIRISLNNDPNFCCKSFEVHLRSVFCKNKGLVNPPFLTKSGQDGEYLSFAAIWC